MGSIYGAQDAKCPFFLRMDKTLIVCEGLVDKSTIQLSYQQKQDRMLQFRVFCCSNFDKCEIHRLLLDKYQD